MTVIFLLIGAAILRFWILGHPLSTGKAAGILAPVWLLLVWLEWAVNAGQASGWLHASVLLSFYLLVMGPRKSDGLTENPDAPERQTAPAAPANAREAPPPIERRIVRFRYIDATGKEVPVADVPDLVQLLRAGAVASETLLFDDQTGRWAPAMEHDVFRASSGLDSVRERAPINAPPGAQQGHREQNSAAGSPEPVTPSGFAESQSEADFPPGSHRRPRKPVEVVGLVLLVSVGATLLFRALQPGCANLGSHQDRVLCESWVEGVSEGRIALATLEELHRYEASARRGSTESLTASVSDTLTAPELRHVRTLERLREMREQRLRRQGIVRPEGGFPPEVVRAAVTSARRWRFFMQLGGESARRSP